MNYSVKLNGGLGRVPYTKDYDIFGSILGSTLFMETTK